HYAPNDLVFYNGDQFPDEYRGAAFIAFHGSWNRSLLGQRGYHVAVVPFADGKPKAPKVFADGFAGSEYVATSRDATHRPMGLAVGPEGELYVSDSREGFIWRIDYRGE
ncbi:MAG: sorbosone dehydrogenase, partial [Myxococcota bacterium]